MTTPAQAAAQQLTGSKAFAGPRNAGARIWIYGALLLIAAVPVFLAVPLVTRPGGWAVALVSIVLGVALWAVWGRLFPSNVLGTAAADADGTVRVLTGPSLVTAYRKMHDTGVRRWRFASVLLGLALVIVPIGAGIAIGVAFFAPSAGHLPLLGEALAGMLAFAIGMSRPILLQRRAHAAGGRVLDAAFVLPQLGLYAHRHGDAAALAGVPADRLAATVRDATAEEQGVLSRQTATLLASRIG